MLLNKDQIEQLRKKAKAKEAKDIPLEDLFRILSKQAPHGHDPAYMTSLTAKICDWSMSEKIHVGDAVYCFSKIILDFCDQFVEITYAKIDEDKEDDDEGMN